MFDRDFSLAQLTKDFNLILEEKTDLFSDIPLIQLDEFFGKYLRKNIPLAEAINTEKAKSEMIIAPVLLELKSVFADKISLFSGVLFNVNSARRLNGFCDFLISLSNQQLYVKSPIIIIVEAKNNNIINGLPQCIAEMVAAQIFNQKEENQVSTIYGTVTNGIQWKFLQLQGDRVEISLTDSYIINPEKILGILTQIIERQQTNEVRLVR